MQIIQKKEENAVLYSFAKRKTSPKRKVNQLIVMVSPDRHIYHWKVKIKKKMFSLCPPTRFVACGAVINLATYKEHAIECKAKIAKVIP